MEAVGDSLEGLELTGVSLGGNLERRRLLKVFSDGSRWQEEMLSFICLFFVFTCMQVKC